MSNELYQRIDALARDNADLTVKLQAAEAENASLRLALEGTTRELAHEHLIAKRRDESLAILKRNPGSFIPK